MDDDGYQELGAPNTRKSAVGQSISKGRKQKFKIMDITNPHRPRSRDADKKKFSFRARAFTENVQKPLDFGFTPREKRNGSNKNLFAELDNQDSANKEAISEMRTTLENWVTTRQHKNIYSNEDNHEKLR